MAHTFNKAINHVLAMGVDMFKAAEAPAMNDEEYKKWLEQLPNDAAAKLLQPLIEKTFFESNVAKKLEDAGYHEGSEVWEEYKWQFIKDTTIAYNDYWSKLCTDIKLKVVGRQVIPDPELMKSLKISGRLTAVPGLDEGVFKAGMCHSIQIATIASALAGNILHANNVGSMSDPKTALITAYAVSSLADMLWETASKYIDPNHGAIVKSRSVSKEKWNSILKKYMGNNYAKDFKKVEAVGKMIMGAGTTCFAAAGFWQFADSIKEGDSVQAALQFVNGLSATICGFTLGVEGVAQWTGVFKSLGLMSTSPEAFDAGMRFILGKIGWAAGIMSGLALTGISIYDMAKGARILDKSMEAANSEYIRPNTGWYYEFLFHPQP